MRPAFVASFVAAAALHALLLFGFQLGTPARLLAITDDTAPVDVNLVAAEPEVPVVPPTPPEPTPQPPAPPPVPVTPPEIAPPPPEPVHKPAPTPAPPPPKPRAIVQQPAKKSSPQAVPVAPTGTGTAATPARFRSNPKPAYPAEARERHQEGLVLLSVQVGADGRPASVSLKRSSGFPLLDQAAIRGVQGWTFEPARAGGIAISSRVDVPVRFALSGR